MVAALAACGTAATPAATGSGAAAAGTLKIGVFEPATGENGAGGQQEVLGIRYAQSLKPTVTIGGKTYNIQLVEVDNQSDKAAAVTAAQSLINNGVIGVLGSYGSGVSIAAGSTFATAKIPAVGCSCTNPQVTAGNDYYFRVCFLDPFQGTVMKISDYIYVIDFGSEIAQGVPGEVQNNQRVIDAYLGVVGDE